MFRKTVLSSLCHDSYSSSSSSLCCSAEHYSRDHRWTLATFASPFDRAVLMLALLSSVEDDDDGRFLPQVERNHIIAAIPSGCPTRNPCPRDRRKILSDFALVRSRGVRRPYGYISESTPRPLGQQVSLDKLFREVLVRPRTIEKSG